MEIKGSITDILKGLENTNISKDSLVGKPINDSNGNKIGVVTKTDINNDIWYGSVSKNIFKSKDELIKTSVSLEKL